MNSSFMKSLIGNLDVISSGVRVAVKKGHDVIPSHELSLSSILNTSSFMSHELDLEGAIHYLRRDSLMLPQNIGKGIVLLKYGNLPLGFVKNLGSRANNLLPKPWSIKSSINDLSSIIKIF